MKFYKQLILSLVFTPCYFAIETFAMEDEYASDSEEDIRLMEDDDLSGKKEESNFNIENFKQIVSKCTWLSNEDKAVFLSLPEISQFQEKRAKFYNASNLAKKQWGDEYSDTIKKNEEHIRDLAKKFFEKHLGINVELLNRKFAPNASDMLTLNEALYTVAGNVINDAYYDPAPNFDDVDNSELETFSRYSFTLSTVDKLIPHIVKGPQKSSQDIVNDLYAILRGYELRYIYRQEHLERVKLGKRYKEYADDLGDLYCIENESTVYASIIRNELKESLYNFYGTYIDDDYLGRPGYVTSDDICKEISKIVFGFKKEDLLKWSASSNEECIKNFSKSRRIKASYFTGLDLLPITVHEAGHAVGDAYILATGKENLARVKNLEAIAMYFEILQYEDKEYKDYRGAKVDLLSSLYFDLTNVVCANMLLEKIPNHIRAILNLKDLTDEKQETYVRNHRALCEKVLGTLRSIWNTISPKFQESGSKRYKKEVYELSDVELADQLSIFGEEFTMDPKTNKISFQFDKHNKALFHIFKVRKQAAEKDWNLEQILSELACTEVQTPSSEECKEVINWLLS